MENESAAAMISWLPILLMLLVFYFLIYKPQQKARNDRETMLNRLHIGHRIITIGGIYGTIDDLDGDIIKLKIADNVIIDIGRAAVSAIVEDN